MTNFACARRIQQAVHDARAGEVTLVAALDIAQTACVDLENTLHREPHIAEVES